MICGILLKLQNAAKFFSCHPLVYNFFSNLGRVLVVQEKNLGTYGDVILDFFEFLQPPWQLIFDFQKIAKNGKKIAKKRKK